MIRLLIMAVAQVHFKCKEIEFVQKSVFGHGRLSGSDFSKPMAQLKEYMQALKMGFQN